MRLLQYLIDISNLSNSLSMNYKIFGNSTSIFPTVSNINIYAAHLSNDLTKTRTWEFRFKRLLTPVICFFFKIKKIIYLSISVNNKPVKQILSSKYLTMILGTK